MKRHCGLSITLLLAPIPTAVLADVAPPIQKQIRHQATARDRALQLRDKAAMKRIFSPSYQCWDPLLKKWWPLSAFSSPIDPSIHHVIVRFTIDGFKEVSGGIEIRFHRSGSYLQTRGGYTHKYTGHSSGRELWKPRNGHWMVQWTKLEVNPAWTRVN